MGSGLTLADAGSGVAAGGAGSLLQVEAVAAAAHAQCVHLVPALPEAARALALRNTAKAEAKYHRLGSRI